MTFLDIKIDILFFVFRAKKLKISHNFITYDVFLFFTLVMKGEIKREREIKLEARTKKD
jgi:hypothetical protein